MYITLSDFPPRLVGVPYGRYVKENIFDRLGMTSSGFSYQNANSRGQRADGMARQGLDVYSSPFAGSPRAVKYWTAQTGGDDGSVVAGAGGVITNAVDLAQWLRTLINDGRHPDTNETVLPPGALDVISRAYSIQEGVPYVLSPTLVTHGSLI
jgi:CubicO group peptidase (beta-lactamase class C family)